MTQAPWCRDGMSRVRLFYLLVQGAFGVYLPFINVYLKDERRLTGREIGLLAAVAPLMTLLVAPVWGSVADKHGSRLRVLRWSIAGTAGGVLLLGIPRTFPLLLPAMGIFTLFQIAIIPLGDGVISAAAAERVIPYGHLRLWGSIGFALGGVLLGQLALWFGLGAIFPTYAFLLLLALPVMWQMVPHEPPPSGGTERGQIRSLLRGRPLVLFLIIAGLAATSITAGYQFLFVFLHSLGVAPSLIGIVSFLGAFAEVPLMLWGGRLIQKHGAPRIFAVGMGLFVLSWALYSGLRGPAWALAIQVLNGAGMGLLWPAGVTYMARQVPAGQTATAQSLLSAMMYGVAPLVAAPIAGAIFDTAGARMVLTTASGTMVLAILLFAIARRWIDPQSGESTDPR